MNSLFFPGRPRVATFARALNEPGDSLSVRPSAVRRVFATLTGAAGRILLLGNLLLPRPALSAEGVNVNAPAISGEIFDLKNADLAQVQCKSAAVEQKRHNGQPALQIAFTADTPYPNIQFPCPAEGWNLSSYGSLQAELTNTGTAPLRAGLRVDNRGDFKDEPWNLTIQSIAPGETKSIRVEFGKSNGAPGYPLDSEHVTGVQVFVYKPSTPATLILTDLRATGSPEAGSAANRLSSPADRKQPVSPEAWVGQRPPVEGDWVLTLDEHFTGQTLNEKVWGTRLSWSGTLPDWSHRFSKDNLILENGVLKIKCERRTGHCYDDPALPVRDYTTALITSFGKWRQSYGYFEAKMKMPTARGLWPAFWMMPDRDIDGPKRESTFDGGMEFDVVEHLTEWGPGRYNVAAHWDGYEKEHKTWASNQVYYGPIQDGWHNWGMLWEPGKLTWYCDGIKKAEFISDRVGSAPADLIIDVHMGGWATRDVDQTSLPDYLQIAYVKAWQLRERIKTNTAK